MVKVLVTGGAGYIGSHLVDLLIERGYEVVVIDNLSTGHREQVNPAAVFVEGDLLEPAAVDKAFALGPYRGVFHLASLAQVGESMADPLRYLGQNVAMALSLLTHLVHVPVIFMSSCNVYGAGHHAAIAELDALRPSSPYGQSKADSEVALAWAHRLRATPSTSLRLFNAAGAFGHSETSATRLIPNAFQAALMGTPLVVNGNDYATADGTCIRDYVHVRDIAEALVLAFEQQRFSPGLRTYNLGTGVGTSIRQVVRHVEQATGKSIALRYAPRRPGDPAMLVADVRSIKRSLGWAPRYNILEMVSSAQPQIA